MVFLLTIISTLIFSTMPTTQLPSIKTIPEAGLLDQDTAITINNLDSNEEIIAKAEATDDNGIHWTSWGLFRSDKNGDVDLSKQPPLKGTYSGIDSMGLLWSMQSEEDFTSHFTAQKDELSIVLTIFRKEQEIASKKMIRFRKSPEVRRIPIRENGLVGTLFLPPSEKPLPVIIVLNGSNGGIGEERSQLLSSHGFAVFALGYFGVEGLPPQLHDFPLEYFETAFDWIRSHPNLDSSHVGIYGISRGGELSLIIGAWFSESVQAIVAAVPSSVITGAEGDNLLANAWSYQGKPLAPFAPQAQIKSIGEDDRISSSMWLNFLEGDGKNSTHPASWLKSYLEGMKDKEAFDAASIPVEKIQAPLMVISGGDDQVWPSALYSSQIEERLRKHESPIYWEHLYYPKAGHRITMPSLPQPAHVIFDPLYKIWFTGGGTVEENRSACQDSWKKLISFFEKFLKPQQSHEQS